jgi:hypothetical protein
MANALQLRRGTTTQHNSFTGLAGEVTVDTDKDTVVVHDGSTAGGFPLATSATIATEVAALVDSAPGTLDTLNELAAALGDDPNFATTVTNSIATKMPLAGGTFTGNVSFSTGVGITGTVIAEGAQIDISGIRQLNAQIATSGSGYGAITCVEPSAANLRGLELEGQLLRFGTNSFTETASIRRIQIADNGDTSFYEDTGTDAKLEWKSGLEELRFEDNVKATFGADEDLQIYHDGSNSYIKDTGTGNLRLSSSKFEVWNPAVNEVMLQCVEDGAVRLYHNDAERITTSTTGVNITGTAVTDGVTVDGTLDIEEVFEKVVVSSNTSGTATFDTTTQGVVFFSSNQTANRTINFSNVNANLGVGQSVTGSVLMAQGSTAYYLNTYQVDGSAVTPKWSGGSAPAEGNASGIDVYTFTIIKTADATFTVLASQTQYA